MWCCYISTRQSDLEDHERCCGTHARKHVAIAEKSLATDKTRDVVDVPELEDRILPTNWSCPVHIALKRS